MMTSKRLLLLSIIAMFLWAAIGCEPVVAPEQTGTAAAQSAETAQHIHDTISVDTFNLWREQWSMHGASWLDTASLEAFNMPLIDLEELLGEAGVADSRYYLGLKQLAGSGYEAKLMLVGVDSLGRDMINYDRGEYVYDLSSPCPPTCN
jgi:hypothetical protein